MFRLSSKTRPRWYHVRWALSSLLVRLAQKIHPPNPDVYAFQMQLMMDQAIYGKSMVRVSPNEYYKEQAATAYNDLVSFNDTDQWS